MYQKTKDGIFYNPKVGSIVEHHGYSTRIHWSTSMLDYLRRHFPTTLNEELAGCLGVSQRTMIRKARELGLTKDAAWLQQVWDERRRLAHVISKRKGYPGGFVKGVRNNPDGEFKKGRVETPEQRERRVAGMLEYNRKHPDKLRERAKKAWVTRRENQNLNIA
jgi:hypothetical protein